MSLFFEDEIEKLKDKANSSELLEILSQDPRGRGEVPHGNERGITSRGMTREDNSRNRKWY